MGASLHVLSMLSLVSIGAIFGFFYAWICSTMWGLDATDPQVAIAAMQAMNASVRNAVFFPAFFLTPVVLGVTAVLAMRQRFGTHAMFFGGAALVYAVGGLALTVAVNVPMNEALAEVIIPEDHAAAQEIWSSYSTTWQQWNVTRTVFSGLALVLTGCGLVALGRRLT